jgi:hypothetical protein
MRAIDNTGADAIVARLESIGRHLRETGHPEAIYFNAALSNYQYAARRGMTFAAALEVPEGLDRSLGLVPKRGQKPWWRVEIRRRRDELFGEIADDFFPNTSTYSGRAKLIVRARARYWPAWLADKSYKDPPPSYLGRVEWKLFLLLKSGGETTSRRRIRQILGERSTS